MEPFKDLEKKFIKLIEEITGLEYLKKQDKSKEEETGVYLFKPCNNKILYMTKRYLKYVLPDGCYVRYCKEFDSDIFATRIILPEYLIFEAIGNLLNEKEGDI